MKRSGFKNPGKPLAPGKGFKPRTTPMNRGTSVLKTSKPLNRGQPLEHGQTPLARARAPMKPVGARAKRSGQGKVAPTAQERAWMDRIAEAGCIVCWLNFHTKTPAEVHHLKQGDRRMGHLFSIGLCTAHHRGGDKEGPFISRHPWKARFEAAYGTDLELLAALRLLLAV